LYMRGAKAVILRYPPPLLGERAGVRALGIYEEPKP